MTTTKQDLDNYLDRITAIQETIVAGSQASKLPLPSGDFPYWLNLYLIPRIRMNTDAKSSALTLICQMQLIRGKSTGTFQEGIETQIIADYSDVLWAFATDENYKRLIVGAFTAIQPGFVPSSVKIATMSRTELSQANTGEVLGSFYTLEWQHKMVRTLGA